MNPRIINSLWIAAGIGTLMWVSYSMGVNSATREAYLREAEEEKNAKKEKWDVKWIAGSMTRVETTSGRVQIFVPARREWVEMGKSPFQQASEEVMAEVNKANAKPWETDPVAK